MSTVTFPSYLGGNGTAYSDDGSTTATMLAGGHRTHLFAAIQQLINVANAANTAASNSTGTSGLSGTSVTSVAAIPAAGTDVTLTTQSGKSWVAGCPVIIADTTAPATRWITGLVKSYATTTLVVTTIDATGTFPGSNWTISPCALSRPRAMKQMVTTASITTLASTDGGSMVRYAGGLAGDSIILPSASAVGAGWFVYIRNANGPTVTGTLSITPTGSDSVDGSTGVFVMYSGETRMFYSTGSAWLTVVIAPFAILYSSSATWVKPTGYNAFRVICTGAGGGGGSGGVDSSSGYAAGGNGGNGGCAVEAHLTSDSITLSVSVVIGTGGTGGAGKPAGTNATGNDGSAGGSTSFGSYLSARGGGGGRGGLNSGVQQTQNVSTFPTSFHDGFPQYTITGGYTTDNTGTLGYGLWGGCGAGQVAAVATQCNAAWTLIGGGGGACGTTRSAGGPTFSPASSVGYSAAGGTLSGYGGVGGVNPGQAPTAGQPGGGGGAGGAGGWSSNASQSGATGGAGQVLIYGVI